MGWSLTCWSDTRGQRTLIDDRRSDEDLSVPRGACASFIVGVELKMRRLMKKGRCDMDSPDYDRELSKILEESKSEEDYLEEIIGHGSRVVRRAEARLSEKGSKTKRLQKILKSMEGLRSTEFMCLEDDRTAPISLRELQAFAVCQGFPVVLVYAFDPRKDAVPRIDVLHPDNKLLTRDVCAGGKLTEKAMEKLDKGLWMVLSPGRAGPTPWAGAMLLHAHTCFRRSLKWWKSAERCSLLACKSKAFKKEIIQVIEQRCRVKVDRNIPMHRLALLRLEKSKEIKEEKKREKGESREGQLQAVTDPKDTLDLEWLEHVLGFPMPKNARPWVRGMCKNMRRRLVSQKCSQYDHGEEAECAGGHTLDEAEKDDSKPSPESSSGTQDLTMNTGIPSELAATPFEAVSGGDQEDSFLGLFDDDDELDLWSSFSPWLDEEDSAHQFGASAGLLGEERVHTSPKQVSKDGPSSTPFAALGAAELAATESSARSKRRRSEEIDNAVLLGSTNEKPESKHVTPPPRKKANGFSAPYAFEEKNGG
eukprot:scaffold748_cov251-Pinguiococcus_pyrenoidosus.AAC.29